MCIIEIFDERDLVLFD